ncbi:MAG: hypothetical protein RR549_02745 [Oscillospiraceae bacterium]
MYKCEFCNGVVDENNRDILSLYIHKYCKKDYIFEFGFNYFDKYIEINKKEYLEFCNKNINISKEEFCFLNENDFYDFVIKKL